MSIESARQRLFGDPSVARRVEAAVELGVRVGDAPDDWNEMIAKRDRRGRFSKADAPSAPATAPSPLPDSGLALTPEGARRVASRKAEFEASRENDDLDFEEEVWNEEGRHGEVIDRRPHENWTPDNLNAVDIVIEWDPVADGDYERETVGPEQTLYKESPFNVKVTNDDLADVEGPFLGYEREYKNEPRTRGVPDAVIGTVGRGAVTEEDIVPGMRVQMGKEFLIVDKVYGYDDKLPMDSSSPGDTLDDFAFGGEFALRVKGADGETELIEDPGEEDLQFFTGLDGRARMGFPTPEEEDWAGGKTGHDDHSADWYRERGLTVPEKALKKERDQREK